MACCSVCHRRRAPASGSSASPTSDHLTRTTWSRRGPWTPSTRESSISLVRRLSGLVGELATRSDEFAGRWAKHNELELTGDALPMPGEDLTLIVYTAAAGSPEQEKHDFLAPWADRPPTASSPLKTIDPSDA